MKKFLILLISCVVFFTVSTTSVFASDEVTVLNSQVVKTTSQNMELKIKGDIAQPFSLLEETIDFNQIDFYSLDDDTEYVYANLDSSLNLEKTVLIKLDILKDVLIIHLVNNDDDLFYVYNYELSKKQADFFINRIQNIVFLTEDIRARVSSSINSYYDYIYNHDISEMVFNFSMDNEFSTLSCIENCLEDPGDGGSLESWFEYYTQTDSEIDSYSLNTSQVYGDITDDDIVDIIPKDTFFELGEYLFIGEEYGFYIHTTNHIDYDNFFASDVIIFDIEVELHDENSNSETFIRVSPIINYKYQSISEGEFIGDWNSTYNDNLDGVVYAHTYEESYLYLHNVEFRYTVLNAHAYNIGDSGYVLDDDFGFYIHQSRYSFSGITDIIYQESFIFNSLSFALGSADPRIGALTFLVEQSVTYNNDRFGLKNETIERDANKYLSTSPSNFWDHKNEYGHLLKTSNVKIDTSDTYLIHDVGDYAEASFQLNRQGAVKLDTDAYYAISLDVMYVSDSNILRDSIDTTDVKNILESQNTYFHEYITY